MPEIYVSVDVETDGPCPGLNSMLSIGAAALDPAKGIGLDAIVGQFSANVVQLPGAKPDPITTKWWEERPEIWELCRRDAQDPAAVFGRFAEWLDGLPRVVFVGYPLAFDFSFVHYYLHRFAGRNPFGYRTVDVGSYAMAVLGGGYDETATRNWPEHWFDRTLPHTHVAIEDAVEQGVMFLRILNDHTSGVWGAPLGRSSACPVCARPGGSLIDGPHTYGTGCHRRKFG